MSIVVFDTEYTSWKGCLENGRQEWQKEEIVQLAALKLNERTLDVEAEFNVYVKPRINPVLSDYFVNLTGITNQKIAEEGVSFAEAYSAFKCFSDGCVCYSHAWTDDEESIADGVIMRRNLVFNEIWDDNQPIYKNLGPWFKAEYLRRGIAVNQQCSGEIAELLGVGENLKTLGLDCHNALFDIYSIREGLKFLEFGKH